MFVSVSSRCLGNIPFADACRQLTDLEFDKVEIWLDEASDHLKPSEIVEDSDRLMVQARDATRLTPVAISLAHDIDYVTLAAISRYAKALRITQITIPASPLGTPFNEEIDRLKAMVAITSADGVRLSIKTSHDALTADPHTAVELCQAASGLGLTLDPSHYICGPRQPLMYDQVFPYVYHVHLRDTLPNQFQVQVGLGELDYSRLINQLKRCDYTRALSVELLPELNPPEVDQGLELRKIRMLLETLL